MIEVHGKVYTKVSVCPQDVIEQLIIEEIGHNSWVYEEEGKYYKGYDMNFVIDGKEEITVEKFEYVKALKFILKTLKDRQKFGWFV